MMTKALAVSIAANVLLLGAATFTYVRAEKPVEKIDVAERTVEPKLIFGKLSPGEAAFSASDLKSDYERFKSSGVDSELASLMLAATVSDALRLPAADAYWTAPASREFARQVKRFQQHEAARHAVLQIIGESARTSEAFAFLFRPLDERLGFLSSEKQIAVEQLRIDAQRELLAGSGAPSRLGLGPNSESPFVNELKKLLTPGEFVEYQLRESPTAQILAATMFDFSEAEFRKVFEIADRHTSSGIIPFGSLIALSGQHQPSDRKMSELKEALGEKRFLEFKRAQDPTFKLLVTIAGANGLQRDVVNQAYEIIDMAAQKASSSGVYGPVQTGAQRQIMAGIIDERDRDLQRLLGAQSFSDLRRTLDLGAGRAVTPRFIPSVRAVPQS